MDIESINRLKKLRDDKALTQEEFDNQIFLYLSSDGDIGRSTEQKSPARDWKYGIFILGISTILILASVFLFTKHPPKCNDSEVQKTLGEVIKQNFQLNNFSLNSFSEVSYDMQNDIRSCQSNVVIDEQTENIIYTVQNSDSFQFLVSLDGDNYEYIYHKYKLLCNEKEIVIPTLFEVIEEVYNIKPLSVKKYKDLSYNEKTYERQCAALLNFENNEQTVVKYRVEKTDEGGLVSLDDEYTKKSLTKRCYVLSERYAEEAISSNYAVFKDIKLSHPTLISKKAKEDEILCKSSTNLRAFPSIYYKLSKEDDEVYVTLESPFECNEASMMIAQAVIVSNYIDFKNLKLSYPQETERTDDVLICQADTNFVKIPVMSYQLKKIDGNNIAEIYVNPVSDVKNNAIQ